jgi:DNA-binding MarR family transcriptional regulator
MESNAVQAWEALLRAHAALVPRMERALAASDVPLAWYDVLLELANAPGHRLRMSDLGERVVLSRTRVSRIVDELEAGGLVVREANPEDGRSAYARITAEGRRRFLSTARIYTAVIEREFGAALSPSELQVIASALRRVVGGVPD